MLVQQLRMVLWRVRWKIRVKKKVDDDHRSDTKTAASRSERWSQERGKHSRECERS